MVIKLINLLLLYILPWMVATAPNGTVAVQDTVQHGQITLGPDVTQNVQDEHATLFPVFYNQSTAPNTNNDNGSQLDQYPEKVSDKSQNDAVDVDVSNLTNGSDSSPHPVVAKVIRYVGYVTVPTLLVTSLTGNSLTLIVMFSNKFWNSPYSALCIALALSDSIYSIVFPFSKLFVREMIGYDPRAISEFGCNIFFVVHKASKMCSSWFVVAICAERFVAVLFPLKAKVICSKRNTYILVLLITTGMFIFTGLWTFSTTIINGICIPNYASPENAALTRAYLVAGSLVYSVIPATLLLILTPIIVSQLHRQMNFRQQISSVNYKQRLEASRATAMLLGVTIAYIVLVTPTSVAHNVCFTLNINFYESKLLSMSIARAVLQVMEQLNFSINFFLYIMCNKSFRNKVLVVVGCGSSVKLDASTDVSAAYTAQSTL